MLGALFDMLRPCLSDFVMERIWEVEMVNAIATLGALLCIELHCTITAQRTMRPSPSESG